MTDGTSAPVSFTHWRAWGTRVSLGVQPARALPWARSLVEDEIAAVDLACSRFRGDSELSRLNRSGGRPVAVSPRFMQALEVALGAAMKTDGAVDPTIANSLEALGYDQDFDVIAAGDPDCPLAGRPAAAAGWEAVRLDSAALTATLPPGVHVDLGATAKAFCADAAAVRAARTLGAGVLVDIGGDIATWGPAPIGGWRVGVVENARAGTVAGDCVVAVSGGALATSGTTARTWERGGTVLHHIIDPRTGWPADPVWSMVTVAAGCCVDANSAATASIVWGDRAPFELARLELAARLVDRDGMVTTVGGWPDEDARSPVQPQGRGA
ncbi:MAG TPA: FAD:protein FMN transferase [Acidimicrobiales bacterium]|nr:FAD:protein FMN transferase [Acidimicrobiales bacterium]